jgi:protein TonB
MTQLAEFSGFLNAHALTVGARHRRSLTIAVITSLLVQAGVIGMMSGKFRPIAPPAAPKVLEVLITPAKPMAVAPEPPQRAKVQPERMKRTPLKRALPEEKPPLAPEPKPVLALPSDNAVAPAFTVPSANIETRPTASEQKPAIAPGVAPPPRETVATTPPDFNAAYLRNARPNYPLAARRNGIEGRVNLKVLVTREGRPAQVLIQDSSGSSALDNAALEAVKNWQFVAARRGQEPLESWVIVPIIFKLENAS